MARQVLTMLSGACLALFPLLCHGLGLGEMQVESWLNQPLRASIELVGISEEDDSSIHARLVLADSAADERSISAILHALKLSVTVDANHKHLLVVTSTEPITEPLLELPVEVAADSVRVERSFAVLLDPAPLADAPQSSAAPAAAAPITSDNSNLAQDTASPARALAHSSPARQKRRRPPRTHSMPMHAVAVAKSAQEELQKAALEKQLTALQQMLSQMQATIAAQDAQIAELTRRIAARAQRPAARPPLPMRAHPPALTAATGETPGETPSASSKWVMYYWIVGCAIVAGIVLAFLARTLRRKGPRPAPKAPLARKVSAQSDDPLARLERSMVAHVARPGRTSAKKAEREFGRRAAPLVAAAQDGSTRTKKEERKRQEPVSKPVSIPVAKPVAKLASKSTSKADTPLDDLENWRAQSMALEREFLVTEAPPTHIELTAHAEPSPETAVTTASAAEEPPAADLLPLNPQVPSGDATLLSAESPSDHDSILEFEVLADTEVRPFVMDALNRVKPVEQEFVAPVEDPNALGSDLDYEPQRDDKLKLLEIYHHEALRNKENFHTLLSKLSESQGQLSPAQRIHIEMLQRTLDDSKPDATVNIPVDVAV